MDAYSGGRNNELTYEVTATAACSRAIACLSVNDSSEIQYSWFIQFSSNIFGCIGLQHKEYCILNKQYTKEEYLEIMPRIIEKMNKESFVDEKGLVYKYGEFFPESFSPFAYNETTAQEYFPLSNEEMIKKGYRIREPDEKKYVPTIMGEDLLENISEVDESITKETIGCVHKGNCDHQCTTAFRIISSELDFYKRMNIPLPDRCPNCRHQRRLEFRNPIKTWHRKCQCGGVESKNGVYKNLAKHHLHGEGHCEVEFETSYAPDRSEIVYCEKCYQQEVV